MKFLCDNCKAKYQIPDERVAGKIVRMKCRKCGHQIEVRADVMRPSQPPGAGPSTAPFGAATMHQGSNVAPSLVAAAPPGAEIRRPSTQLVAQGAQVQNIRRPTPPAGMKPPLPRPASGQHAAAPVTSVSQGLADAFTRTVKSDPPPPQTQKLESGLLEEWYVAINRVPVGPIRLAEIRKKAQQGSITEESLVWREGLEEWRPLRTITELAQIVREAAASNRPSLATPPPDARVSMVPRTPPPPPMAADRTQALPPLIPSRPPPRPSTAGMQAVRSNVVPIGGRTATAERLDSSPPDPRASMPVPVTPASPFGGETPLTARSSLSSIPPPHVAPAGSVALTPPPPTAAPSDPFAAQIAAHTPGAGTGALDRGGSLFPSPAAIAPPHSPMAATSLASMPPPRRASAAPAAKPWWFTAVLVFVGMFGAVAAVMVFAGDRIFPKPVAPMPSTQTTATTPSTAEVPSTASTAQRDDSPDVSPTASGSAKPGTVPSGGRNPIAATGTAPTPSGSATVSKIGIDLGGLAGGTGPTVGPNTTSGGNAGGQIDQNALEGVVRTHQVGVRRACWERGPGEGKPSAKVTVTISLSGGTLSSASSSGTDASIGKCIENNVRQWSFSSVSGSGSVAIPFSFVRQ